MEFIFCYLRFDFFNFYSLCLNFYWLCFFFLKNCFFLMVEEDPLCRTVFCCYLLIETVKKCCFLIIKIQFVVICWLKLSKMLLLVIKIQFFLLCLSVLLLSWLGFMNSWNIFYWFSCAGFIKVWSFQLPMHLLFI